MIIAARPELELSIDANPEVSRVSRAYLEAIAEQDPKARAALR